MEFSQLRTLIHVAELGSLLPSPDMGCERSLSGTRQMRRLQLTLRSRPTPTPRSRTSCATAIGWTILPLAPIHESVVANALTAAPLIDLVPVRRLVLSFPADSDRASWAFRGKAIVDIVAYQVERAVWVGQLLDRKAASNRIPRYLYNR
jgi:hypothetical protein